MQAATKSPTNETSTYDVAIIGGGPGGYVAALRAAKAGLKTALIEKDPELGGTCLHRGCIPTKNLLQGAALLKAAQHACQRGLLQLKPAAATPLATGASSTTPLTCTLDFAALKAEGAKVIKKSTSGLRYLMKEYKVEVYQGQAYLQDPHLIEFNGQSLTAKQIILATGSRPKRFNPSLADKLIPKAAAAKILTSDELLAMATLPTSLLIVGGGAIGLEFADILQTFNVTCTLVEKEERLLPTADSEIGRALNPIFTKRGIACYVGHTLAEIKVQDTGELTVTLKSSGANPSTPDVQVNMSHILLALGREPQTEQLFNPNLNLHRDAAGYFLVDKQMRTNIPHIYAIGDILNTPQLAHTAMKEALIAVDSILGKNPPPLDYRRNPHCLYTHPEVASVGLTEEEARAAGYKIKVSKFPFTALAKARLLAKPEGFIKIIMDTTYEEILGVHILGEQATELIGMGTLALNLECTASELADTIQAHPTLSEAIFEAAQGLIGQALHL